MFLQIIYLLVASTLAILLAPYCNEAIHWIIAFHQVIVSFLNSIFAKGDTGLTIAAIVGIALIPILIVAVPAILFFLVKRRIMPYLIPIAWGVWLIVATAVVIR